MISNLMTTRSDGPRCVHASALAASVLAASVLASAACSSPALPPPAVPSPPPVVETGTPDLAPTNAAEILDRALSGENRTNGGSGPLTASIGNTFSYEGTGETMSFVFACTGPHTVTLTFKNLDDDSPGSFHCGDGIFQENVTVTPEHTVSFSGTVAGPAEGTYAYAWLTDEG